MSRERIEMLILDRVYEAEKVHAAMVGHDRLEVAVLSFGAFCGVYSLIVEPERPYVWQRPRVVIGRGNADAVR